MKKSLLLLGLSTLLLTSCGYKRRISDLETASRKNAADIASVADRVTILESQMASNYTQIEVLQIQIDDTNDLIAELEDSSATTEQLEDLVEQVSDLEDALDFAQSNINSALASIAILQGYNNIVSIKDPCGDGVGFDEVFLKLSNGKYLASFSENSSGKNTRFSLLADGTFATTDGTNCQFTVSGSGTVISNEHN